MYSCRNILVPTDFGDAAAQALEFAIMLGSKFGSAITLLHAATLAPSAYAVYAEAPYWPTEQLTKAARSALDQALSDARTHYAPTEAVLLDGDARDGILSVAKERGVDLIVMGTHGRRGLSRLLLGSVAEWVVRHAEVPVVTVSGVQKPGPGGEASPGE